MNRLQIVEKYMSHTMFSKYPEKFAKAQKLHKKIIAKQDKKWKDLVIDSKEFNHKKMSQYEN